MLSERFDALCGIVVTANALIMGIEYAYEEKSWGKDGLVLFGLLDMIFLAIFTMELLCRIVVMGLKTILKTPVFALDFFIVFAGWLADVIIPLATGQFFTRFEVHIFSL